MNQAFVVDSCPTCHGTGVSRNTRHFFYAICLIACGFLCFFQWPPTDGLFSTIWSLTAKFGCPNWVGSAAIWTLTGVPAVLGFGFLYAWIKADTCKTCNGRRKTTRFEQEPNDE